MMAERRTALARRWLLALRSPPAPTFADVALRTPRCRIRSEPRSGADDRSTSRRVGDIARAVLVQRATSALLCSTTETLGLLINGVDSGINGLKNHDVAVGDSLELRHDRRRAGRSTFYINVTTTGDVFYSDKSLNADGVNHVYSTAFTGSAHACRPAPTWRSRT